MACPELAETMLEPFKFQGVYGYDDVGIIVRGKFMAKAGIQFAAKKEILARVRNGFEEYGIEFARKEVRVQVPGLDNATELDAKQKEAIAAGASQAAEQMIEEAADGSGASKADQMLAAALLAMAVVTAAQADFRFRALNGHQNRGSRLPVLTRSGSQQQVSSRSENGPPRTDAV